MQLCSERRVNARIFIKLTVQRSRLHRFEAEEVEYHRDEIIRAERAPQDFAGWYATTPPWRCRNRTMH